LANFLIIESGSTKCDWAFVDDIDTTFFQTSGINPITGAGLDQILSNEILSSLSNTTKIFFYGAGTNSISAIDTLNQFFQNQTGKSFIIDIQSDLLASARALLNNEEGIVAILGTGSNSCFYTNDKIVTYTPSLGYLLSDEGSGNHIGKELLKAYFYNEMSENDKALFFENYNITRENTLQALYKDPKVAAYLAGFSRFLGVCSNELKTRILTKVFEEFVQVRIKNIPNFSKFAIHFTGSIAFHYKDELKEVLNNNGCVMGIVMASPLQKLIEYHKSRENV
jgi:glucosamine kinase